MNKLLKLTIMFILMPLPAPAQRVIQTNEPKPDFPKVSILLPVKCQADTLDRGFFLEGGFCPQDYSYIGIGLYEKIRLGEHFISIMDAKMVTDGIDIYNRIRLGVGLRYHRFHFLAFMPQFNQKNWKQFNTPFGVDVVYDTHYLMCAISVDIYRDTTALTLRVRFQR